MIPRRLVVLALATLLVGGAGVGAAVNRASDDGSPTDAGETAAPASTTTSSFVDLATTTTTEPPPAVTTTTTGPPRSATTSTTRRATTTTRRGATTTTTRSAPPTTGSATPACTPDHLVAVIATDRPSYAPAQVVQATSTLRNRSSSTCFYNGWQAGFTFKNDAGTTYGGVQVIADSFADVPLRPGETLTHTGSWDHRACPEPTCGPLPAGPYYATVRWSIASHTYEVLTSLILSA